MENIEKYDDYISEEIDYSKNLINLIKKYAYSDDSKKEVILEQIKLVQKYEQKYFNMIPYTEESKKQLIKRQRFLMIRNHNISKDDQRLLNERFKNSIDETLYHNPFHINEDSSNAFLNNYNCIVYHSNSDIIDSYLEALLNEIQSTKNKEKAAFLYKKYVELIIINKNKLDYLTDTHKESMDNQEKCLLFGHNKDQVERFYSESYHQNIMNIEDKAQLIEDKDLTDEKLNLLKYYSICLRCNFEFQDSMDFNEDYDYFQKLKDSEEEDGYFENKPLKKSTQIIGQAFETEKKLRENIKVLLKQTKKA